MIALAALAAAAGLQPIGELAPLAAEAARGSRFVLIGEQTHGTEEFYRTRARLTEHLVREHGFTGVAIEADWSATRRVDLYVRGLGADASAEAALGGYTSFPRWMWRNTAFRDFVESLRAHNLRLPPERRVGVHGMDVYDLFNAADAVVAGLRLVDPAAARRAATAYRCFAGHGRKTSAYGESTRNGRSCARRAAAALDEVGRLPAPAGHDAADERFALLRAASSVVVAEEYFRLTYSGSNSWNAREQRMAETVAAVAAHANGKLAIWAHNSHVGDGRAIEAPVTGQLTLGQLLRARAGAGAYLIGQFTYSGNVRAAPEWDAPATVYRLRPALPGSYAALLRGLGSPAYSLVLRGNAAVPAALRQPALERAVGVIYRPGSERQSHYFRTRLLARYDAVTFHAETRALEPLGAP